MSNPLFKPHDPSRKPGIPQNENQRRAAKENFRLFQLKGIYGQLVHLLLSYETLRPGCLGQAAELIQEEIKAIKFAQLVRKEQREYGNNKQN